MRHGMRQIFCVALLAASLGAQTPSQAGVVTNIEQLRAAIEDNLLSSAAMLAAKLSDAVQKQFDASLVRDSALRVNEVLTWLPDDIESLWVNQAPFTINSDVSLQLLYYRPIQAYSVDRLMAQNGGSIYAKLNGRTIRLVIAAARKTDRRSHTIPDAMMATDVACFYFFTEPIDLPAPDESLAGRPVWRTTAIVHRREFGRGVPATREDGNWIALARPDLLVLANRRELLSEILQRVAEPPKTRALPGDLPEWTHVDMSSSFWALRHYTAQSKPPLEWRRFQAGGILTPDEPSGVTVRFDANQERLEILYLSTSPMIQTRGPEDAIFAIDQPQAGVWRLTSDVKKSGPWPIQFAFTTLGFEEYR